MNSEIYLKIYGFTIFLTGITSFVSRVWIKNSIMRMRNMMTFSFKQLDVGQAIAANVAQ